MFVDVNGNGGLDSGEPSSTTDGGGNFTLGNLTAGSYQVAVENDNPSERFTLPTGGTATVTVSAGQTTTQNFGVQMVGFVAPVPSTVGLFATTNTDANVAYVRALYEAILGRDATDNVMTTTGVVENEAVFWANLLSSGQMIRAQVAQGIVNSPEHRMDEVNYFYQTLLGRTATTDPQAHYWVNQLLGGVSEAAVVKGLMDNPEFQNAHSDNATFVQDLYFDVLGRHASQSEISNVVGQLTNGATRDYVESSVINSPESVDRQVAGFYAAFFHRTPDSGASVWESDLSQGASAAAVEAALLSDPTAQEFFNDAKATVQ